MQEIFTSSTQYGDIKGNVTIDGFSSGNLHDFAKDNSINTNQYFPVGIKIYRGENGHESISIIAVDTAAVGIGTTYDNIKDYFDQNEDVDVKRIDLPNATFEDYLKKCKRFSIAAASLPELMNKKINIS
jgi:hypothetical protein